MGFGFNLLMAFLIFPLSCVLLLTWVLTRKKVYGLILGVMWLGIFGVGMLSAAVHWLTSKKDLKKSDYHGTYIVNRDYFKGQQVDWQYNTFRFEIKENDSIIFYVTEGERISKTYRGIITTTTSYASERLIINMQQPTHHVISSNPTTFRRRWNFYLIFYSPEFNNVFFKKGEWEPITLD